MNDSTTTKEYVLADVVIEKIKSDKRLQTTLQQTLKCTSDELKEWIEDNKPDNKLTNVKAVHILQVATMIAPNKIMVLRAHPQCKPFAKRK